MSERAQNFATLSIGASALKSRQSLNYPKFQKNLRRQKFWKKLIALQISNNGRGDEKRKRLNMKSKK